MTTTPVLGWRAIRARTRSLSAALLAVPLSLAGISQSQATPLNFTLFNPSGSLQSRLDLTATGTLSGAPLTSGPQLAPGGLNGPGSESTLYNDTASTDSKLLTNVTQQSIVFPGGSTAVANNAHGLISDLQLKPNVGGASGTAVGNYGILFSSPQDVVIPPIDISALNIPGITTLDLGTLTAININVALRGVVVDVSSGSLPLNPNAVYPQTFDSSQLNVSISGTSDLSIQAILMQSSFSNFIATGAALLALQSALTPQGISLTYTTDILHLSYGVGFGSTAPLPANLSINDDASQGTLEHIGGNLRLTVPIKFNEDITGLPAPLDTLFAGNFGLSGKLIGQTAFVQVEVPEPSSVALAATGLAGLLAMALRRRHAAQRPS